MENLVQVQLKFWSDMWRKIIGDNLAAAHDFSGDHHFYTWQFTTVEEPIAYVGTIEFNAEDILAMNGQSESLRIEYLKELFNRRILTP